MTQPAAVAGTDLARMEEESPPAPPVGGAADVIAPPDRETVSSMSPRRLARIAGALYLVNVVAGAFAIGYVNTTVFAADPAITAANIQSHQLLYRSGLAAHVVVTVTNIPLALIFYELLKRTNRTLALLDAFFILVATAIEAAGILGQFAPLVLLGNGAGTSALPPTHLQALASLTGPFAHINYTIYTVFFGLDILLMSYLLWRSRLVPRAIAVLLAVDGLAYLVYSFTDILAPGLASHLTPWVQLPAPLAEGGLSLWLLAFGVNLGRWTRGATGETPLRLPQVAETSP
jgi:hypothetical protein